MKSTFKEKMFSSYFDLIEELLLNSTDENDWIFDGFMGSGSVGVACKNNNRNFIGFEINKDYFNIAESRINNV